MTITEALIRVGEELKQAMINQLKSNGSYNTGDLGNSITYSVVQRDYEYDLVRTMLKYGNYVDQGIGRGPGRIPPVREIMEWVQMKKIPVPSGLTLESFAFAIAKNIGKKGTDPRPRPFIAPSINKVLQTTGREILQKAGVDTVTVNINNTLQDIKITA